MTMLRLKIRFASLFGIVCLGLGLAAEVEAEVRLPNGEYTETVEDLSVKVLGGFVVVRRSWTNGRWYLNPAWADLRLTLDSLDGSVKALDRAGSIYEKAGNGVFVFDGRFFIRATADGFRWYDQQGNWISYDANGHLTAYGDRNDVHVRFVLDTGGRRTQVLDHFNNPVLTFQYAGDHLASVTDRTGRSVQYAWSGSNLVRVVDVLGFATAYTYDGNGQVTSRTDPEGRTTTIVYAQSTPAGEAVGMKGFLANNPTVSSGIVAKAGSSSSSVASTGSTPRDYKIARVATVTDPEGNVTTYSYEYDRIALRYTVRERMPGGRQLISTYDREGYLLQQRTGGGRQLRALRRDGNRVDLVTDERGLVTRIEYDAARRPLKRTYPDGTSVTTTYDSVYGNPLTRVDEAGTLTLYQYDAKGNLLRMSEASGLPEERVTTYAYDEFGQRLTLTRKGVTLAGDATTSYAYDTYGNQVSQTNPLGATSHYIHDVMGNVTVLKDPRGNEWAANYNAKGWMLTNADPLNHVVSYDYDRVGNRVKVTDAANNVTVATFDQVDRPRTVTDPLGGITRFEYDSEGRRTQVTDPEGVTIRWTYDADGRPSKAIDGNGNATETVYGTPGDGLEGLVAAVVYPTYTEHYRYDLRDRVTQETKVVDAATQYTSMRGYGATGNVVSETDARGHTTLLDYDARNRLVRRTDALGGVTSYRYDLRDNLVQLTDAKGSSTSFAHDLADRLTSEMKPLGETTSYAYDANGNRVLRVNAKGEQQRYTHDAANRVTQEQQIGVSGGVADLSASRTITFHYDARNLVLGYDDGTTKAMYAYDAKGLRTQETVDFGPFAKTLRTRYRGNGSKASFTYPDGAEVSYAYDPNNQLERIATPAGSIEFAAYRWWAPTLVTAPGVTKTITYDGLLRPTQIKVQADGSGSPGSPTGPLRMAFDYQYDGQSNPVRRSIPEGDFGYQYDALGRVTSVLPPASLLATPSQPGGLPAEGYAYDAVDNRLASQHQPGPWLYNANHQLVQHGQGAQQVALQYDANGHTIGRSESGLTRTTRYDTAERAVEVREGDSVIASFYYDPLGRRLKKTVGGTTTYYQYADEGLVAEFDANGVLIGGYGWPPGESWMGQPQFRRDGARFAFYHNDHLGTPQRLTDVTGALVWSAEYEAFGEARVATALVSNPLRFPGQYYDAETGLHYNYFRDYDPAVGRYRQSDPIGLRGGINTFAYANGDPLTRSDPLGLQTRPFPPGFPIYGPDWPPLYPVTPPVSTRPDGFPWGYGCGDAGTDAHVPDQILKANFLAACRRHDTCYETCGIAKQTCDNQFGQDLVQVCMRSAAGRSCFIFALGYFAAMKTKTSQNAFDATRNHCPCG